MEKVKWVMGGEPLVLHKNPLIMHGNVRIYPHIEIDKSTTYDELLKSVNEIKNKLYIDCCIYNKNTYTYELNGSWNIVISIICKDDNNLNYYGMYVFIIIKNKIYGCPFCNEEYVSTLRHHSINSLNKTEYYRPLEKAIIDIFSKDKCKLIEYFPFKTLVGKTR